ncbi:MAG TPA: tRNA (guanosine(46)-N7)-methyltransferase TrmB [Hyphomicrobiaceae bacterium]|nr:tRNA (guanosine(46)-N7)-methyltransferase TrmB [Hyphomicrobiaceae bacterium]
MDERHRRDLRSYGRRRGRKPSRRQVALIDQLLPDVVLSLSEPAATPLSKLFVVPVREVWLEIGFGGGEHLLWQAAQNPDVGLIGCEPFQDGVTKVLRGIEDGKIANVRLYADDARAVLRWLPEASLARAFILFPDPWPKKRHQKRRLVSVGLLRELARVMAAGAELRVATDIGDYARAMLQATHSEASFVWEPQGPGDWRQRPVDWPATRYEQKAIHEGRRCTYLSLRRR